MATSRRLSRRGRSEPLEKTTDEHLKTSWQPHAAAASLMKNDLVAHVIITSDDVTPRFVEWAA